LGLQIAQIKKKVRRQPHGLEAKRFTAHHLSSLVLTHAWQQIVIKDDLCEPGMLLVTGWEILNRNSPGSYSASCIPN